MKILIIAFVVGCVIALAFRSCHHTAGSPTPAEKQQEKGGFFGAFHKAAEGDNSRLGVGKDKKPRGPYDIWSEKLRAECGPTFVRTDAGQYEVGRMSNKGFVLAIKSRVVRVLQPDGRAGFVVCDDSSQFLPADVSASNKPLGGAFIAAGSPAEDRKALFRTGGGSDGGLTAVASPPSAPVPSVAAVRPPDGSRPHNAAEWWPSSVPGW